MKTEYPDNLAEQRALFFAEQAAKDVNSESREFAIIPDGYDIRDLTSLRNEPPRVIARTVKTSSPRTLSKYTSRFQDDATTAYTKGSTITVYFDHHEKSAPNRMGHRIHYAARIHPVVALWKSTLNPSSEMGMHVKNFTKTLRRLKHTITSPAGSDMLEILNDLRVIENKEVNVQTLRAGFHIESTEHKELTTDIPQYLTVSIPVVQVEKAWTFMEVEVEVLVSMTDDDPRFTLEAQTFAIDLEDHIAEEMSRVAESLGIPVYEECQ